MTDDQYITPSTAAKRLGLHHNTIYRMIENGRLKAKVYGEGRYLIPASELDQVVVIREGGGKPTIIRKEQIA